jgi:hypothetical protein
MLYKTPKRAAASKQAGKSRALAQTPQTRSPNAQDWRTASDAQRGALVAGIMEHLTAYYKEPSLADEAEGI